jgi:hypothetical protein
MSRLLDPMHRRGIEQLGIGPGATQTIAFTAAAGRRPSPSGRDREKEMGDFFGLLAAGPFFFVSSWVLMLFAGGFAGDIGIKPFGYLTSMVVTIALWLTLAPAVGAIARTGRNKPRSK